MTEYNCNRCGLEFREKQHLKQHLQTSPIGNVG
jgi:hypothetical protein